MAVWERFRAKVEEFWPEANRGSEVNDQDNFASAQYPQSNRQNVDLAVICCQYCTGEACHYSGPESSDGTCDHCFFYGMF